MYTIELQGYIFIIWLYAINGFMYKGGKSVKRTYQPKKRHRTRVHGFLGRMRTKNGRKVIASRRSKGRAKLAV